ncbi:hypothetical protein LTR64_004729 [Lithohypha guttulata]|uniref:uncharacterized protein n=1 Tax=Lithohypha guttulata TaxID=1690604 RepID=UPI002DE0E56B|nr:hypothetical protein LTR51_005974 [Lithohypha guttulata]
MSTRSSPFRRAGSPSSPSAYRASTPPSTSRVQASPLSSPSKLKHSYTVSEEEEEESMIITPTKSNTMRAPEVPLTPSPARKLPTPPSLRQPIYPQRNVPTAGDDLAKLPPALLHSLRESFSVLDSNSTGTINPSSVAETLQSLGLSTNEMSQLFPPGQPQQISLPQYLNSLAAALVNISPQQELLNALSAFDDDDSGQIDVVELRRALLATPPEPGERALSEKDIDEALKGFTGRRILAKSGVGLAGLRGIGTPAGRQKNGDVFRYHEFVSNLSGGPDPHLQPQPMPAR